MINKDVIDEAFKTDFSISHSISTSWSMKDFHFHDLYQIYFSLCDNVKCFINDSIYDVKKGDLFIFSPTDFHKIVVEENTRYERYHLLFNPEYIDILSTEKTDLLKCFKTPELHRINLSDSQCSHLIDLFEKASSFCALTNYGADVQKRLILAEILIFINTLYEGCESKSPQKSEAAYTKIQPILKYIQENLHEDLSLDYLSNKFYISKYYMASLFKKTTGFSINEYIINKRILKSKELLRKNLPVSQVAEMVGFHNYSHFIRTFKKLVGVSPKQYVKMVT